jgi:two-component system nitrate/nitrite response regulator NarL
MRNRENLTTLVVDDDEFVLGSLPSFLIRVPGVNVVGTAKNGYEALAMIKRNQPKMVVMDVRMPRMDGIEATGIIRKQFPNVRVVLTSGLDDPQVRMECLGCGAHGFMAKLEVSREFPILVEKLFGNDFLAA